MWHAARGHAGEPVVMSWTRPEYVQGECPWFHRARYAGEVLLPMGQEWIGCAAQ